MDENKNTLIPKLPPPTSGRGAPDLKTKLKSPLSPDTQNSPCGHQVDYSILKSDVAFAGHIKPSSLYPIEDLLERIYNVVYRYSVKNPGKHAIGIGLSVYDIELLIMNESKYLEITVSGKKYLKRRGGCDLRSFTKSGGLLVFKIPVFLKDRRCVEDIVITHISSTPFHYNLYNLEYLEKPSFCEMYFSNHKKVKRYEFIMPPNYHGKCLSFEYPLYGVDRALYYHTKRSSNNLLIDYLSNREVRVFFNKSYNFKSIITFWLVKYGK